jgi:hypothetical protein
MQGIKGMEERELLKIRPDLGGEVTHVQRLGDIAIAAGFECFFAVAR